MAALGTILIWGTTFVSTKILLCDFKPVEILFFRFLIGYITLWIVCPHRLKNTNLKQEALLASAGLFGITLYYLFENIALVYTMASNAGVIISCAPFITALIAPIFIKSEQRLSASFFAGFIVAIIGISLISFNSTKLELNPLGDILAFFAAVIWASYSICTKKINLQHLPLIPAVRKTFLYGLIFMIPVLFIFDFHLGAERFLEANNLLNILFLGLFASALCFVTWNFAVKALGVVKTSVYIYLAPVVTVITANLILREPFTALSVAGTALTILGLFISKK